MGAGDGAGSTVAPAPAHVIAPAPGAGDGAGSTVAPAPAHVIAPAAGAVDGAGSTVAPAPAHVIAPAAGAVDGAGSTVAPAPAHVIAPAPGAVDGAGSTVAPAPAHVMAPAPGAAGIVSASARAIGAQAAGQAAGENFPVALRMLPRRYRQHLVAVYGFARSADDMGDKAPVAERLSLLNELEADVARLYRPGPGTD